MSDVYHAHSRSGLGRRNYYNAILYDYEVLGLEIGFEYISADIFLSL